MSHSPEILEVLREAEEEARAIRPKGTASTPEREKRIDDLIGWHEGDNLDWDAIERAHYNRA